MTSATRLLSSAALLAGMIAAPSLAGAQTTGPAQPPPPVTQPAPGAPGAAGPNARHHRGGMMGMLRTLNLSDAQKTQIRSIVQKYRAQRDPQTHRLPPATQKQMRDEILGVLTPAQRDQLKDEMARARAGRGANGTDRGANGTEPPAGPRS